jgi:hypothetical protein
MKRTKIIVLFMIMFFFVSMHSLIACEIEVKVKGDQKQVYEKGDFIILEILVFLTHRDCPEGIKATKFAGDGIKLVGAKSWNQISAERYSRLVKAQITGSNNGEAVLHARRKCDKEGGHGVLKLKVK